MVLANPLKISVFSDTTLIINRLSGAYGIEKVGGGPLIMAIPSVYAGSTTITAGLVFLGGNQVLPDRTPLSIANGATLDPAVGGVILAGGGSVDLLIPPPRVGGDMNCDGLKDGADIAPWVLAVFSPAAYHSSFPACNILNGDFNADNVVTAADLPGMVNCLLTGVCP